MARPDLISSYCEVPLFNLDVHYVLILTAMHDSKYVAMFLFNKLSGHQELSSKGEGRRDLSKKPSYGMTS